ncbi:hypothetical protein Y032_0058g2895 [Ancylostoma ceylanicum]|uniref:Uncharacterized protein n=1 Tax=Ancylostoma ceylanicum TaxID=53326 RepID=A0A016U3R3_9BILA|nr:hypothetical protein Y032_0058g2895 [Ancylostoma ceylanicum]
MSSMGFGTGAVVKASVALLNREHDNLSEATPNLLNHAKGQKEMRSLILFGFFVAAVAADTCPCASGNWSFEFGSGVTDFAHGGEPLSSSSCFDGCLATGLIFQNFKVALSNKNSAFVKRRLSSKADLLAYLRKMRDNDDDPNADTCIDPDLRSQIKNVLNDTSDLSCQGIVNTLVSSLNRPGWAMNCAKLGDFSVDASFKDVNFCFYMMDSQTDVFLLRLAKIDYT